MEPVQLEFDFMRSESRARSRVDPTANLAMLVILAGVADWCDAAERRAARWRTHRRCL